MGHREQDRRIKEGSRWSKEDLSGRRMWRRHRIRRCGCPSSMATRGDLGMTVGYRQILNYKMVSHISVVVST